ncbi:hypothetical protein F5890DRAFT_1421700, partial [Lentinula detonsa]
ALNYHLHRIAKTNSPNCPHCDIMGQQTKETVKHYLLECPAYRKERFNLRRKMGWEGSSLQHLLSNEKSIPEPEVLQFIGSTK